MAAYFQCVRNGALASEENTFRIDPGHVMGAL